MGRARLAAVAALATLLVGALAPAAFAQGGAGLYSPFPEPARPEKAREFFGDLIPTSVSTNALRAGVILPAGRPLAAAGPGAFQASKRAGLVDDPDGGSGWLLGAAIVAAAGAGLAFVMLRRAPEPR
jgi:hypothetical protein